ncbi:YchF family ATPase, partial [Candidatus Microgenomates bacterium]|nr:YchF family ATPase [Candidatus Microgenomates bacterium]
MLQVGIVGLPNVGKSTLFNALLRRQQALVANYPFATIEPNVGVVPVPDERLTELQKVIGPGTPIVPATVRFVDIAGLVKGAAEGAGLGNKFLAHIREVDLICEVVRAFPDSEIVREGSVDPLSDIKIVETELGLADLETVSKLLDKKFIYVLNVNTATKWPEAQIAAEKLRAEGKNVVVIDAKLEADLALLSPDEQEEYLASLGIGDSGVNSLIREAYKALDLISFLTAGKIEVRAWPIRRGTLAPQAAG